MPIEENPVPKSKFRRVLDAINKFLDELDEEEPEPEPEPEKPIMESIRDFIERWRDPEKRAVMLKEFGEWCWTMFFRGTVFFFLFVLTIWATIWALDFSENHEGVPLDEPSMRHALEIEKERIEVVKVFVEYPLQLGLRLAEIHQDIAGVFVLCKFLDYIAFPDTTRSID